MSEPIDIRNRKPLSIDQVDIGNNFKSDLAEILLTEGEILSRVRKQAEEISKYYKNKNIDEIHAICVLKGAIRYFSDLLFKGFEIPFTVGVASCSRYSRESGTTSRKKTEILLLHPEEIRGKHILLVEDIFDEGWTLKDLIEKIKEYNPLSISLAILLDKPERRQTEIEVDNLYTGFIIPNKFVVGYGLDFQERYRGLNHLGVLKPEIYEGKI